MLTALAVANTGQAAIESPPPPQVWSDKADYAPGETVTLSGANWAAGESVHIVVNDDAGQTWRYVNDVTAAADGTISDQFVLPDWFVAQYTVTATGASSGTATWSFTDGNVTLHLATAQAMGATSITVAFQIFGTSQTANTNCSGTAASSGTVVVNAGGKANIPGFGNANLSVRLGIVTSAPAGKTIDFWADGDKNNEFSPLVSLEATPCISAASGGTNGNVTDAYAHLKNVNAAPLIASDNATRTVNEGQTATNTGTWSDANAGDTVTLSASVGTVTKAGTNASGTWSWSFATSDGPADSQTVTITANDGNGGVTSTTFSLAVNNVAPTATFANNGPVNEGSDIHLSLTSPFDPSSVDTAAGFEYAFDCGSGYGAFGASNNTDCSTTDNGTRSVKGKIRDQNGGVSEYTATVTIDNVAPSATFANTGPVNEGSSFQLSLTGASDPSSPDTAAGFTYAFDCGGGSGYGAFGSSNSASCPTTDNGSRSVKGKIKDKDGGVSEYTASVTVNNVAPTLVSVTNDGPIDEGGSATVSVTATDPAGAADPLAYEFDCNNDGTYEAGPQAGNTHACSFSDDGSRQVNVRVSDGDGGAATGSTTVTVHNVDPTASATNNGPIDEGGSATITAAQTDPGADTFEYAFDCNNDGTFGAYQAGNTTSCSFGEDGSYPVGVKVRDDDGGVGETSTTVVVENVAPTVGAVLLDPDELDEGGSTDLSASVFDPGADDGTLDYAIDWGDGSAPTEGSTSEGSIAASHTYADDDADDTYTVIVTATDSDGDSGSNSADVSVHNVDPTISSVTNDGPVDEGSNATITVEASDPAGANDPLTYHFDCDNDGAYEASNASGSHACHFNDDSTHIVGVRVTDGDGGSDTDSTAVVVNNVAPSVNAPNDQTATEGQNKSFNLGSFTDPGDDGPWQVHVTWGDASTDDFTQAAPGSLGTLAHTYADNGMYTVHVTVAEAGSGSPPSDSKSFMITVANVPPNVSAAFAAATVGCGANNATLNVSFTDPGSADTHTASIDWGDGSPAQSVAPATSPFSRSHTYAAAGMYNGTVTVMDDDGGSGSDNANAITINFTVASSGLLPPVSGGGPSVFKYGSTIPAKTKLQDCDGSYPGTLAPRISVSLISGAIPPYDISEPYSTSAADTTGIMRFDSSASQYIYNLASKQLADPTATYRIKVTIPATGQIITADFGLKK